MYTSQRPSLRVTAAESVIRKYNHTGMDLQDLYSMLNEVCMKYCTCVVEHQAEGVYGLAVCQPPHAGAPRDTLQFTSMQWHRTGIEYCTCVWLCGFVGQVCVFVPRGAFGNVRACQCVCDFVFPREAMASSRGTCANGNS